MLTIRYLIFIKRWKNFIKSTILYLLGIYSDQFKSRGSFYLITQSKPDFCGEQYLITIKISANSNKTAGEIFLKFGDTSISITKSSEDIKPGIEIKKLFAINSDIYVGQSYSLNFNKKPKVFYFIFSFKFI